MLQTILKQKYQGVIAILGFILISISFFKVDDFTKYQFSPNENPVIPTFIVGILLIFASIVCFLITENVFVWNWLNLTNIKKIDNGFSAFLGEAKLNVIYGKIQDYNAEDDSSVIILPANEFFDDDCINDKKSSMGAYMHSKFPNQIHEIQQAVHVKTKDMASIEREKETGIFQKSYGVGKCIFLDKPIMTNHRIILASVTSHRAGQGIRSEISYIFQAVNEIFKILMDKRIFKVYSPLMGAGHGCLEPEVALFALILAWSEILYKPRTPHIEVTIIVFRSNENIKPRLNQRVMKKILEVATGMFKTH
jgi:hypothetical protein